MKCSLRFSAHALFLAAKHKQTCIATKVIPVAFLVFNELQKEDKAKYKQKLTLTNGKLLPDPYEIVENWKSDVKLMLDVSCGDMYNHLVNSPIEYTRDNLKAYKPLEAFNFFVSNHVQDIYNNETGKESELCSIKTKGIRKITPWKPPPYYSHPENSHLEHSHPFFQTYCFFIIITVITNIG